jgi:capsular exopolysaccharide synthesis family protein
MGRIEEALKRASGTDVGIRHSVQQKQFVSAWGEEDLRQASAKPAPAAISPVIAVPPAVDHPFDQLLASAPQPIPPSLNGSVLAKRLISTPECDRLLVEQFRRLAAGLHKAQGASGIRIVMVTSASPADGKTLTAINLALSLSGSYKRKVLLIDADLRRPSLARAAGLNGVEGLSEGLKARNEQKLNLVALTPTLTLLPAGVPDPDPMSTLTSARMRRILNEAVTRFDWVLIDAPPLGPVADANLLAEVVDTALLVVRAARTQFPHVQKAIEVLGRDRVLGIVLNGVEDVDAEYGAYYGR